jgi:pimeloyl-ACP methyl ester carboxylesterase
VNTTLSTTLIDNSALYRTREAYDGMMDFYDRQLARLTVLYQTRYVNTRHGQTYVLTAGYPANPPMVLWHGMNANLASWVDQINEFGKDFYIIAPDTVGDAGRSDPRRLDRKSPAYGEWAADVLKALNISNAHMVGISGGGWMILRLATVAPQLIRSATLISTAGLFPISMMILIKVLPWLLFAKPEASAKRFLTVMSPPYHHIGDGDVESFMHLMKFKSQVGIPPFTDSELSQLTAPSMLLMGQYEKTCNPLQALERAKRCIPGLKAAELVTNVGHGMTGENPVEVHDRIRKFIASVS